MGMIIVPVRERFPARCLHGFFGMASSIVRTTLKVCTKMSTVERVKETARATRNIASMRLGGGRLVRLGRPGYDEGQLIFFVAPGNLPTSRSREVDPSQQE